MKKLVEDFVSQKKEIELSLARTILLNLQKKVITFDKAQEIARFIVARLDGLTTEEKLLDFLRDLSRRWYMFATIRELYKINYA